MGLMYSHAFSLSWQPVSCLHNDRPEAGQQGRRQHGRPNLAVQSQPVSPITRLGISSRRRRGPRSAGHSCLQGSTAHISAAPSCMLLTPIPVCRSRQPLAGCHKRQKAQASLTPRPGTDSQWRSPTRPSTRGRQSEVPAPSKTVFLIMGHYTRQHYRPLQAATGRIVPHHWTWHRPQMMGLPMVRPEY